MDSCLLASRDWLPLEHKILVVVVAAPSMADEVFYADLNLHSEPTSERQLHPSQKFGKC